MDLDAALQDPHLGSRVRDLVLQWETLRWSNHQAKSSAP